MMALDPNPRNRRWPWLLAVVALATLPAHAQENWSTFEKYQGTITRKEFCSLIDHVYNPSRAVYAFLNLKDDHVTFLGSADATRTDFTLRFATPGSGLRVAQRTFRTIAELETLHNPPAQPLRGVRIALDPGHIGGKWADIEERCVAWGGNPIIREGDKNLMVARLLKSRLEAAGALTYMTHETSEPVTPTRPKDYLEEARALVFAENHVDDSASRPRGFLQGRITWRAELLFYRKAEIAQRAENLRTRFLPDLNLSNHFNATERSGSREMAKDNRHAFFINGCYGPDEVPNPTTRYFLFSKLLEQPLPIEMAVGDAITRHMLRVANLPAVMYGREKYECRVNDNPYLYARNLAASRQYPGPCVILEPFYMNNAWTAERLAAGDYEGTRALSSGTYPSLVREYANAVADAVIEVYSAWTLGVGNGIAGSRPQAPATFDDAALSANNLPLRLSP